MLNLKFRWDNLKIEMQLKLFRIVSLGLQLVITLMIDYLRKKYCRLITAARVFSK